VAIPVVTENVSERVELLRDLVRIETENPPGNEAACAEYVVDWFEERGIGADLVPDPYEDRPQAAARVGGGDPTLVLNGHIDVVPAGDLAQWEHDPYGGEVEGGRLYGRGADDMKAGVAAGMLATVALGERIREGDLEGSVVMQAAIGEETAEPGTKRLLELGYDGDYGVVLEPTELRTATSEKGLAWYEITVEGDPSHASRPDQGSNAIRNAEAVLDALAEYDEEIRERTDDLVGQAYATVTEFEAGTKENVVPERATITIDRRFLPAESAAGIDDEIDRLLADVEAAEGIETDWRRTRTYESAAVPVDSDLAETFREHSAAVADAPTDPWGVSASTDVRNFVNDAGMEAITWGPGEIGEAHTFDESVGLDWVADAVEVLERAGTDLLAN